LAVSLMVAVFVLVLAGCAYKIEGKKTGFDYIFGNHDTISTVSVNQESRKDSGSSTMQISPTIDKKVFLTFDDGPDSVITPIVLDILDMKDVKATFFVIGTSAEKNPELIKKIAQKGHSLGNHTYNHKYNDVYSGTKGFIDSIKQNEELLFKIAGQRPSVVRAPGGEVRNNNALNRALAQYGYRLVSWNVESYDSRKPYPDGPKIIESIREQTGKQELWSGMVVIMHDGSGHMSTVRALPTVIDLLRNEGFQFDVLQ
jgi:peptidoglycan/xylan/chitin deacetylase (PgdA/CDA1 family)